MKICQKVCFAVLQNSQMQCYLFPYSRSPCRVCPEYFPTWYKYCCTISDHVKSSPNLPYWKLFWLLDQYMVPIEVNPWWWGEVGWVKLKLWFCTVMKSHISMCNLRLAGCVSLPYPYPQIFLPPFSTCIVFFVFFFWEGG